MKACSGCAKSYANPATVSVVIEVVFHGSRLYEYQELRIISQKTSEKLFMGVLNMQDIAGSS